MADELKEGAGRFVLTCVWMLLALVALGLLLEITTPLPRTDISLDSGFMELLGGAANFVAEIAAKAGWVILPTMVVWLLIRGLHTLAIYASAVAVGMALLAGGGMLLMTFAGMTPGGGSGGASVFSSGSIQLSAILGTLLLVFLPIVPIKGRGWVAIATGVSATTFEIIRVLAGTVSAGTVIGGWFIGISWLAATVWAFRRSQQPAGPYLRWWNGLSSHDQTALTPAPIGDPPLPGGRSSALKLAGMWLLLGLGVVGAGYLITEVLSSLQRFDETALRWLVGHRSNWLSALATAAGSFGTTTGIIGVLLVTAPLASAATGRAAPALFLVVAVVGETALYLISGWIVGRPRPEVDYLSEGVPPTSSFPSGHVAAAVVMYAGLALLFGAWVQSRLRYLGYVLAPLIVLGVAFSRVYFGVHYPTDAIASLLFAAVWVSACWRYFAPDRGAPERLPGRTENVPEPTPTHPGGGS